MPGRSHDGHEPDLLLATGCVEQVLEQSKLIRAADERRLQGLTPIAPAAFGHDSRRAPRSDGSLLALEQLLARLLERDGVERRSIRRLADKNRAGRRQRLKAGRRVDDVAGDHALVGGTYRHGRFAGQHPRANLDRGAPVTAPNQRDQGPP